MGIIIVCNKVFIVCLRKKGGQLIQRLYKVKFGIQTLLGEIKTIQTIGWNKLICDSSVRINSLTIDSKRYFWTSKLTE